jgi:hypothetical protein
MNRTITGLAALMCAGWFSSSAFAWTWPPFAGLRHGTCTTCTADQGIPQGTQVATDQKNIPPGTVVNGGEGCGGVGSRLGALGNGLGIRGYVASAAQGVNQWLLNVPQKTPAPPKQYPINPYVRSPRDYFMMDDP